MSELPDILPCIECSLTFGKPSDPVTYLEESFRDEEGLQICCPGCGTEAWGETPHQTITKWNELQPPKLEQARRFLDLWDELHPEPADGPAMG